MLAGEPHAAHRAHGAVEPRDRDGAAGDVGPQPDERREDRHRRGGRPCSRATGGRVGEGRTALSASVAAARFAHAILEGLRHREQSLEERRGDQACAGCLVRASPRIAIALPWLQSDPQWELSGLKSTDPVASVRCPYPPSSSGGGDRRAPTAFWKQILGISTAGVTDLPRWLFNSVFASICLTAGRVALDSMAGCAPARLEIRGLRVICALVAATLAVPGVVLLIPVASCSSRLACANSYPGVIRPICVDTAGVFMMRQFFLPVPAAPEEAAGTDGASIWTTDWRVVLPVLRPGLITLRILSFQTAWNEFALFLVVAISPRDFTLTTGLAKVVSRECRRGTSSCSSSARRCSGDPGGRPLLRLPTGSQVQPLRGGCRAARRPSGGRPVTRRRNGTGEVAFAGTWPAHGRVAWDVRGALPRRAPGHAPAKTVSHSQTSLRAAGAWSLLSESPRTRRTGVSVESAGALGRSVGVRRPRAERRARPRLIRPCGRGRPRGGRRPVGPGHRAVPERTAGRVRVGRP